MLICTRTVETFKALSEKLENDKSAVMAELEQLSEFISVEECRVLELESLITKLREFLSLEDVTHETLVALIDCIVVNESKGRSQNRTHDVQIVYRFEAIV